MASLKECRRIIKTARRSGKWSRLEIRRDAAACDAHDPGRHRMSGNYVVVGRRPGVEADRCYVWSEGA